MTIQESAIISLLANLDEDSFQNRSKSNPSNFTRNRKLTFSSVVGMILRMVVCKVSEEVLAEEQLTEVVRKMRALGQKDILFVYDRGYPSEKFINLHIELGVDFIFRLPRNFNNEVKKVYEPIQVNLASRYKSDLESQNHPRSPFFFSHRVIKRLHRLLSHAKALSTCHLFFSR